MEKSITISELSPREIDTILKTGKFNSLAPVNCKACGYKEFFKRRIFRIEGNLDMSEDDSQDIVRYRMKEKYDLNSIFFKITNNTNYIDTAFCGKCNSNMVIYDIKLDDRVFDELSKQLNIPKNVIQNDMRKMHDLLS